MHILTKKNDAGNEFFSRDHLTAMKTEERGRRHGTSRESGSLTFGPICVDHADMNLQRPNRMLGSKAGLVPSPKSLFPSPPNLV